MLLQKPAGVMLKILSLVTILLLLLGTVSLISFSANNRIKEDVSMTYNSYVVPLVSAYETKGLFMQNAHLVRYALTHNSPEELSYAIGNIEANREKIAAFDAAHAAGGWKELRAQVSEKQDEILSLAKGGGDKGVALSRLGGDGDITALENDYLNAIDKFTSNLALKTSRNIGRLTRTADRTEAGLAVSLALALIAGLLLAFVVSRSITGPLREMQAFVASFSKGGFDGETRVRGENGISGMSASLRETAHNLRETVAAARKASREISGMASEFAMLVREGDFTVSALLENTDGMEKNLGDVMVSGMEIGGFLKDWDEDDKLDEKCALEATRKMLRKAAEAAKAGGRMRLSASEAAAMASYLACAANDLTSLSEDIEAKLSLLTASAQRPAKEESPLERGPDSLLDPAAQEG